MAHKPPKFERLFLLDGMALAYRAYFSFIGRPLINSKGENTSAIFGFVNTLMKILNDEKPEHIAVVFDTKEPTFRHKMYASYKATREKMPEDMSSQMTKLKEVVEAFNVPLLELPGYEADDIMGTLAKKAEREKIQTFLVTGDKDFMQLISPFVKMYKPGKQGDEWEILDEKAVKEKFGVPPNRVTDVLGLIGDKSDNVPGIPGVGEKTAIPLVARFGTIENIFKNVGKIPQKGLQDKLKTHRESALLSKELVTIDTNVPIEVDLQHLEAKARDHAKLIRLFSELEFKSLLRKLSTTTVGIDQQAADVSFGELTDIHSEPHTYHLISNQQELEQLAATLMGSEQFVFDTETTGTDPLRAELVGLSFAVKARQAWYVPVKSRQEYTTEATAGAPELHGDLFSPARPKPGKNKGKPTGAYGASSVNPLPESHILNQTGLPADAVAALLSPVFSNPSIRKIGQNLKYDVLVLAAQGIAVNGISFDTMVANYVLRPDGQHNMDAMAAEHLKYRTISYDELTGTGKERKELRDVPVANVSEYSCEDADVTFRLYELLQEKLDGQNLRKLCEEVEFPLIDVLAHIELAGVTLDVEFLSGLSKELDRVLQNLTSSIHSCAGEKFNINSTQQLSRILFERLKLSAVRKTKTGYSTDVGVLEALRHTHPIVEQLLEYRQLQKLKSTYVDALPSMINPRTGRLHTSFNQTVASTGRLSSSDPNLQNIPIRTEIGRSIRKAFIPSAKNRLILSADYSQIELRVMAHISGDEGLKEAFRNHEDIHATTAAKVFSVHHDQVSREMRRKAKEVNFGIMYGIGPFGLGNRLDISQAEAKDIITKYFQRFPKVNQYIFDTLAGARRDGYVSTLLGRRRYLPDLNSKNFSVRSNAERQAINMPIQGTAADMIKMAMIRIHGRLRDEGIQAHMLLQVHDELVFEITKSCEQRAREVIADEMKNALPLSIPVDVEVGVGKNWLEAH